MALYRFVLENNPSALLQCPLRQNGQSHPRMLCWSKSGLRLLSTFASRSQILLKILIKIIFKNIRDKNHSLFSIGRTSHLNF